MFMYESVDGEDTFEPKSNISEFTFSNPFDINTVCDVTFSLQVDSLDYSGPVPELSPTNLQADSFTVTLPGATTALYGDKLIFKVKATINEPPGTIIESAQVKIRFFCHKDQQGLSLSPYDEITELLMDG